MEHSEFHAIQTHLIDEPPHKLRATIDAQSLGELADSMATEGLHQPIGVRGPLDTGRYEVVWGHRRLLAARLLHWPTISARLFDHAFDPLLAAVTENLQRTDLNPLEEAHAVQRFIDRGHSLQAIARLFRRSVGWVHSRIQLGNQPPDIQQAVAAGELPLAVASTLAEIDHTEYRSQLVAEAIRTGATQSVVEVWRAHYLVDRDRIIRNSYIPAEINERRANFRITTPCDWCDEPAEYQNTRSFRFCATCTEQLVAAHATAVTQPQR